MHEIENHDFPFWEISETKVCHVPCRFPQNPVVKNVFYKNLFGISKNSQKKTMITKIIMILMIVSTVTVRKNH